MASRATRKPRRLHEWRSINKQARQNGAHRGRRPLLIASREEKALAASKPWLGGVTDGASPISLMCISSRAAAIRNASPLRHSRRASKRGRRNARHQASASGQLRGRRLVPSTRPDGVKNAGGGASCRRLLKAATGEKYRACSRNRLDMARINASTLKSRR